MKPEDPPRADPSDAGIPDVLARLDEVLDKLDAILGAIDVPDDELREAGGP